MALRNSERDAINLYNACGLSMYSDYRYGIVKTQLKEGADPNHDWYLNFNGDTPLHLACYDNNCRAAELLIKWGANIHTTCDEPIHQSIDQHMHSSRSRTFGQTPLDIAMSKRHTDLARLLKAHIHLLSEDPLTTYLSVVQLSEMPVDDVWLNLGLELGLSKQEVSDIERRFQETQHCKEAMFLAVKKSHIDDFNLNMFMKALLRIGNSQVAGKICIDKGIPVQVPHTPLTLAIQLGWPDIVMYLGDVVGEGLKVIRSGQTPLSLAYVKRDKEIIKYLVDVHHCDPRFVINGAGDTPFHLECLLNNLEMIKCLDDKRGTLDDVVNMVGHTPLSLACNIGCKRIVKYLVDERRCDPRHVVNEATGDTLFHLECVRGDLEMIKCLDDKKGNIDGIVNKSGYTPLSLACANGHIKIVKYLVDQYSCNPRLITSKHTPLTLACTNGHKEIVTYLVDECQCDPTLNMSEQTPLSLACANRHKDIITYLVDLHHCDPRLVVNETGDTLFHLECVRGDLEMMKCLDDKKGNLDVIVNKSGQTPLSLACTNGHKEIVEYLVDVRLCDPRCVIEASGQTPLSIAFTYGHKEIIKYFVDVHQCDPKCTVNTFGQTPLYLAYTYGHEEIVKYLVDKHHCDPRFVLNEATGDTPFHSVCARGDLEMIKCIDDKKGNLDGMVNKSGQTPLSLACFNRHKEIIKYLVDVHHCNPRFVINEAGDTPLHLECVRGDLEIIKCLATKKDDLNYCLLVSCKQNQTRIVDYLLDDQHCDPNVKNDDGQTPLHLTTDDQIIRSLLKHGAHAAHVYKTYRKIIGEISSQHPPQNPLPILITGKWGSGKSSFLKAFTKKITMLQRLRIKKGGPVSGVDEKTVGIIPYLYESKRFGRVIIYDFAGQKEFFASHSAVLQNAVHTCPPIIVFCSNLQDSEEEITKSVTYWMNLIQNQCKALQGQAHIVVLGSHADILLGRGENPRCKEGIFSPIIEKFPKFKFLAFVPIDCRLSDSDGMKEVRQHIEKSSALLRSPEVISLNAHTFHVYLQDNFQDEVTVPLKAVREKFQVDLKQAQSQSKKDLLSFIPNTLPRVIEICSQLSEKGHILFLLNKSTPENSHVVCDQQTLLSEITGTVYAPENFRQHCKLASSTGVVPLFKFHIQFVQHDLDMLLAFMSHLEFCFEIKDEQVLKYISTHEQDCPDSASASHLDNRYLFFPGLITIDFPERVWEAQDGMTFHFGWLLHCSQEVQFFDSRCLHVLILRLVFLFNLAPAKAVQHHIPSLQRFCSVWKNGIYWVYHHGITCLVELVEHSKALAVQIRCQELTSECLEFRGLVVSKVLETAQQVCPNLDTIESVILPAEVESHPLNSIAKLSLFEIHDMASAVVDAQTTVNSLYRPASVCSLLQFEPFACLDRKSLDFLCHPLNPSLEEKVSNPFIAHLVNHIQDSNDMRMLVKIFSQVNHAISSQGLTLTLETWRNETEGTYQCLRDTLDKYSIFGGRNPLVLAGVAPCDWDSSILINAEEPEPVVSVPLSELQQLDLDIEGVDETTKFNADDDTDEILNELTGLDSKFFLLGLGLHLPQGKMDTIQHNNPQNCEASLICVIEEWLKLNYDHSLFGKPSWRLLVEAISTVDHEHAKQIASRHRNI